jgi:hypothetical protein
VSSYDCWARCTMDVVVSGCLRGGAEIFAIKNRRRLPASPTCKPQPSRVLSSDQTCFPRSQRPRSSTWLRKLAYSSLSRKRRQENACRLNQQPCTSLSRCSNNSVFPAKAGTQGERSVHECKTSLCIHPCQQAQWYALYRRHKRYCSPCLGTSIRCCRRICSRLRSAQVGICRVSRDYGRCNPPRKAPQEMAPGVETGVD